MLEGQVFEFLIGGSCDGGRDCGGGGLGWLWNLSRALGWTVALFFLGGGADGWVSLAISAVRVGSMKGTPFVATVWVVTAAGWVSSLMRAMMSAGSRVMVIWIDIG